MAQPLPQPSRPDGPDLSLIPGERAAVDPRQRRLRRGLTAILVIGGLLLGYLCLLVRVSALDMECYVLRSKCDEVWAEIANDQTQLGAESDLATNLDRAQANGLRPVGRREKVAVRRELIGEPPPQGEPSDTGSVEGPTVLTQMGTH